MMNGTIARLRQDRGFGFIRTTTGDEYFFHAKQCAKSSPFEKLALNQKVTFEPEQGEQGMRAADVQAVIAAV